MVRKEHASRSKSTKSVISSLIREDEFQGVVCRCRFTDDTLSFDLGGLVVPPILRLEGRLNRFGSVGVKSSPYRRILCVFLLLLLLSCSEKK